MTKTKVTKKSVSIKLKSLFEDFLLKNQFGVYNDSFMGNTLYVRKPKNDREKISDYYNEDFLNNTLSAVGTPKVFLQFLSEILKKGESDVALQQAIKKTPNPKNYEYEGHVSSILNVLEPYKKVLFNYVSRPNFLEHNFHRLDKIFSIIDDQEHRIAILESMMVTKTFNSLDTQKEIYNLVQNHIRQPEILDKHFSRIKVVDTKESVVDFIETPAIIVIGFSAEKLIGANLNTKISSDTMVSTIPQCSQLLKDKFQQDLNIINTIMDYNKENKQYSLNILCLPDTLGLNKKVFEKMINSISQLNSWEDITEFKKDENLNLFIKECKAEYLHQTLNQSLVNKNSPKSNNLKI
jgi:hypothetical protein